MQRDTLKPAKVKAGGLKKTARTRKLLLAAARSRNLEALANTVLKCILLKMKCIFETLGCF